MRSRPCPARVPADKTFQHPLRLLSILALAYLAGHFLPRDAVWLRGRTAAPFVLMGQHGLTVFCAHVPLSFIGAVAIERSGGGWLAQATRDGVPYAVLGALAAVTLAVLLRRRTVREVASAA